MTMDRDALQEYLLDLSEKFYGHELVNILEDAGIIDIWDVLAAFEDQLIEAKDKLINDN